MFKNTVKLLIVLAALSLLINGAGCSPSGGSNSIQTIMSGSSTAKYVGSNACKECHGGTYSSWNDSFHGPAKNDANGINVAHWAGGSLNSMLSCIYCKGTGVNKSVYESYCSDTSTSVALASTYAKLFNEPFVTGCEACHNAGSDHISATSVGQFKSTIGNPGKMPVANGAAVCGQCHSKGYQPPANATLSKFFKTAAPNAYVYSKGIITNYAGYIPFIYTYFYGQPMPADWVRPSYYIPFGALQTKVQYGNNTTTTDTAAVTLGDKWLKNGFFQIMNSGHAGSRQDANYEQSAHNNVAACFTCHDPHSTHLRSESNSVCTKCHTSAQYTTSITTHTKHSASGDGSKCWNCHMPKIVTGPPGGSAAGTPAKLDTPSHLFKIIRPDVTLTNGGASSSSTAGRAVLTPATGTVSDVNGTVVTTAGNKQRLFLPNSCAGGATGTCHISDTSSTKYGTFVTIPVSATNAQLGGIAYSATDGTASVILDAAKTMFPNSAALNYK